MTGLETSADDLIHDTDAMREDHYIALREEYERKRDGYDALIAACDEAIQKIQKSRVGTVGSLLHTSH